MFAWAMCYCTCRTKAQNRHTSPGVREQLAPSATIDKLAQRGFSLLVVRIGRVVMMAAKTACVHDIRF